MTLKFTIKTFKILIAGWTDEMKGLVKAKLLDRVDARKEYDQLCSVVELLELADSRGMSIQELRNYVTSKPVKNVQQEKIWK